MYNSKREISSKNQIIVRFRIAKSLAPQQVPCSPTAKSLLKLKKNGEKIDNIKTGEKFTKILKNGEKFANIKTGEKFAKIKNREKILVKQKNSVILLRHFQLQNKSGHIPS